MQLISRHEAKQKVFGKPYNNCVLDHIEQSSYIFMLHVGSEAFFLSLLFHDITPTRIITPHRKPRTLKEVVNRLLEQNITFEALSKNEIKGSYQPEAFDSYVSLLDVFDDSKFNYISCCPMNDYEKKFSPKGTFYLIDGNHRSLVYAYLLLTHKLIFKPFDMFYFSDRI